MGDKGMPLVEVPPVGTVTLGSGVVPVDCVEVGTPVNCVGDVDWVGVGDVVNVVVGVPVGDMVGVNVGWVGVLVELVDVGPVVVWVGVAVDVGPAVD